MTKADPSKWDQCACGQRKRVVKPACWRCNAKAYEKVRWQRTKAERCAQADFTYAPGHGAELAECEAKRAAERGHIVVMGPDETEDEGSAYVGTCARCERFLVVDVNETVDPTLRAAPEQVYGKVYTDQAACPGTPDALPAAARRSLMELDYAVGGASLEPASRPLTDYTHIAASKALS